MSTPTKATLRAARLASIASSLRDVASPDVQDVGSLQSYDLSSTLWNLGDLFDDMVAPVDDGPPGDDKTFRQPQPLRETRKPIFRTVQDLRPPRGVKR